MYRALLFALLLPVCSQISSAAPAGAWQRRRAQQLNQWKTTDWQPQAVEQQLPGAAQPLLQDPLPSQQQSQQQQQLRQAVFPGASLGGRVIPLKMAPGHTLDRGPLHGRAMLRNGTWPVHGSVAEMGYFYVDIMLGTPGKVFTLIVDTGSSITFVPCSDCTQCGTFHDDKFFDPKSSSTMKHIQCTAPGCDRGYGSYSCRDHGPEFPQSCFYEINYAEGSNSHGFMLEDDFAFPDGAPARLEFGCESGEGGMIHDQQADGILGMDRSRDSFHSQVSSAGQMDDVFGLCFGVPHGGTMVLGDVAPLPTMIPQWSPLRLTDPMFYHVDVLDITFGGQSLGVPSTVYNGGRPGTILDSGTTFTYLPLQAYNAFLAAVEAVAKANDMARVAPPDPSYTPPDICWGRGAATYDELPDYYPAGEIMFAGSDGVNVRLPLQPWQYLFRHLYHDRAWCLAMYANDGSGTLIGGVTMRDVLVTYDVRHARVGFATAPLVAGGCVGLREELAKAAAAAAESPPPGGTPGGTAPALSAVTTGRSRPAAGRSTNWCAPPARHRRRDGPPALPSRWRTIWRLAEGRHSAQPKALPRRRRRRRVARQGCRSATSRPSCASSRGRQRWSWRRWWRPSRRRVAAGATTTGAGTFCSWTMTRRPCGNERGAEWEEGRRAAVEQVARG